MFVTAVLIGLLLLASANPDRVLPIAASLTLLSAEELAAGSSEPAQEEDAPPSPDPAGGAAGPAQPSRSDTPAPAPPSPLDAPPAAIPLAPPAMPVTGGGQRSNEANRPAQAESGRAGDSGTGDKAGRGGGAGSGKAGSGSIIVSWAPDMDFTQNSRLYPRHARRAGIEGAAWMECLVLRRDRVRDCRVISERPAGYGFGEAALKSENGLHVRAYTTDGQRVYNRRVVVVSYFVLPAPEKGSVAGASDKGGGEATGNR